MKKDEIKRIFELDCSDGAAGLLAKFDDCIFSLAEDVSEEAFSIYKKFVGMKADAPESMKKNLFLTMLGYASEKAGNFQYADALFIYRFLLVKSELAAGSFYHIGEILFKLGNIELSKSFLKLYEQKESNKPLMLLTVANFYNLEMKNYKTAIKYYEKYVQIDETKATVFTIIASLYAKAYGDLSLKDQVHYFTKAYNLKPNDRLALHGLAFCYEKLGDKVSAKFYYQKLLKNNPTETDYYNYGAFLISCGEFAEGHKYFTHRWNIEDGSFTCPLALDESKKWNFKSDLSGKVLLVHYEQGFGDTFMYCRFVPILKNIAKKVIFIVQDEVFDLIKGSNSISDGVEVISEKTKTDDLAYDISVPLLDVPYILGVNTDSMPLAEGYLEVPQSKVREYADLHLNNNGKLKVGIAYHGDKAANYNGRDIEFSRFRVLFNSENVEFYSLQVDCEEEEGIISLGETFGDFTDTACAIKNMDIVISTDNVILNLAGALGVKTFGMFNKYTNYRWYKLAGNNVGWYDSVIPFQVEENNCWSDVFSAIINELSSINSVCSKK